tara:strand:+ start:366 stop:689 length:324 start_codon:yes stop_codon:yes gene_type:complete
MDDFGWTKNVHDIPVKDTCWVITNLDDNSKVDVQQMLFNHGFTWASGCSVVLDYDIRFLMCSDLYDVENSCFGFSDVDYIKGVGIKTDVYVFEWVDGVCKFMELEKV